MGVGVHATTAPGYEEPTDLLVMLLPLKYLETSSNLFRPIITGDHPPQAVLLSSAGGHHIRPTKKCLKSKF